MKSTTIILVVLVILLIISALYMNQAGNVKSSIKENMIPKKKKVKFGSKVTRVDYDKSTGDIIPGKITEKLNDTG